MSDGGGLIQPAIFQPAVGNKRTFTMATNVPDSDNRFDVIIIGAGISGVDAAYRLQEGIPDYSYAILEGRSEMGGTWSLFKYPGIRSDSDLHTFGFPWDPWAEDRAIADAPSILRYIKSAAAKHGIDQHVKYQHQVQKMEWKSDRQHWILNVLVHGTETKTFYARQLLMGTGYYDYTQGLNTEIPGLENFNGKVVHPQFWPEDLDYTDQKVIIIGSGATAVTLLPAMNEKAGRVTMLQRSPSYFLPVPLVEPIDVLIRRWAPAKWAHQIVRIRFILVGYLFFSFCRLFPNAAKKLLRKGTESELPKNIPFDPHFVPSYLPWEQRMCITPGKTSQREEPISFAKPVTGGDFFAALRTGKSDVVTDHIDTVTESGIKLKSGRTLDADIIVTATGLKVSFGGGAEILIDGEPLVLHDKHVWNGAMLQDVPNLTFTFGYTSASWTLGADVTAQLWVRLLQTIRRQGMTSVVPKINDPSRVKEAPLLNLNSNYIKAAENSKLLPKGGNVAPWKPRTSYLQDYWKAKWGDITTSLQFSRITTD